jgi:predicted O-methyltransferase YrrM
MSGPLRTLSRLLRAPLHRRQALRMLAELHAQKPGLEELVQRGQKLGSHGFYRVSTLQIPSEILALAREVESLKPRTILEIGTARGGTSLIWAQLASERLITCDIGGSARFSELLRAFPRPGSSCKVQVLIGDSHAASFVETVRKELGGQPVDFLFIDGDHTEAGVAQDFESYRGFVRPGGLIAFHDIAPNQKLATNQVQHFWKRIHGQHETHEIIADRKQVGFGIGVLRVPG